MENIISFATAHGWRTGENPARWRGHLDQILPPASKVAKVGHHAALPWADLPDFMVKLAAVDGTAARAFYFLILTAARTGEVIGARWDEIDVAEKVWTVPAERMKAGRAHRVPLSDPAMAIIHGQIAALEARWGSDKASEQSNGAYIFPGQSKSGSLSDMAFLMMLRRLGRGDITAHGFRSTFRDWVAEKTIYPREIAEAALAHTNTDKTETAYLRGDHFVKRRALMNDWAAYAFKVAEN